MKLHATGQALVDDINQTQPAEGEAALWWLGQHSFVLKLGRMVIYIDPYLSPSKDRLIPPLVEPGEVTNADLVIGTHDHIDHIDHPVWPVIAEASPGARFVCPELNRQSLIDELKLDPQRVIGMDDGQSWLTNGLRVSALASAHELLDRDEKTGHYPFLGVVLEAGGLTIYHAGDTCIYEGLVTKLRQWKRFDLMLLPINGRDAERFGKRIAGNMTYQEAADLAGTLGAQRAAPTHWDMFAMNPGDPDAFERYVEAKWPGVEVLRPGYGQRVVIGASE